MAKERKTQIIITLIHKSGSCKQSYI